MDLGLAVQGPCWGWLPVPMTLGKWDNGHGHSSGSLVALLHRETPSDGLDDAARQDLIEEVGRHRSRGVVIDVAALDVLDPFGQRTLGNVAEMARLLEPHRDRRHKNGPLTDVSAMLNRILTVLG